ncbi:MAG: hypothetical protein WKF97_04750 [Chitinophagaceae bacterium]
MNTIAYFISDLTALIPVAAGLYFFKRLKADRRFFVYFLIYAAIVELTNALMAWYDLSNLWSINIYTCVEYFFYAFILNKWVKGIFMRWMTIIGSVVFLTFWIGHFFIHETLNTTNIAADVTESAVLTLLACFVVTTLSLKTEHPVLKNYRFWFSAVLFIYFSVSVLLSLVMTRLMENPNAYEFDAWIIHTIINISMNVVFAHVFSLKER